jgi:hypothetical protein
MVATVKARAQAGPVRPAPHLDWRAAIARLEGAYSENALRGYRTDFALFEDWCRKSGRSPLPALPETVAEFIAHDSPKILAFNTAPAPCRHPKTPSPDAAAKPSRGRGSTARYAASAADKAAPTKASLRTDQGSARQAHRSTSRNASRLAQPRDHCRRIRHPLSSLRAIPSDFDKLAQIIALCRSVLAMVVELINEQ